MFIRDDGLKLFIIEYATDSIFQYGMSTPFDVSTAVYEKGKYIGSQSNYASDMFIRDDGLKLFTIDQISNIVYSYSLSVANDISTMTYDNISFDVGGSSIDAYSIEFNKDGTKMYVVDVQVDSLYSYSITNWNISSPTKGAKGLYVKRPFTNTTIVRFCEDGTTLYTESNLSTKSLYQINLSVAWDITTSTGGSEFTLTDMPVYTPYGFEFSTANKTILILDGNINDKVYQLTY